MSSFLSETALLQDSKRRVCPNSFTAFSRPLSKVHLFLRMRPLRKESTYAFLEGAEGGRLVVEGQAEKAELEKTRYFGLDKTKPIVVKDGFVTFTEHFKYLRSYISYNLRDDFLILIFASTRRVSHGRSPTILQQRTCRRHPYNKKLIFKAIPLNLRYFYGDVRPEKSTVSNQPESSKLLNITMAQVKDDYTNQEG